MPVPVCVAVSVFRLADTLKLATLASGLSAGTPYFVARDIPCEMCEDIPCAKVCPSGALDREIESIDDADGAGGTGGPENCLNFQGLRCDVCYRECPKIDEAITGAGAQHAYR